MHWHSQIRQQGAQSCNYTEVIVVPDAPDLATSNFTPETLSADSVLRFGRSRCCQMMPEPM